MDKTKVRTEIARLQQVLAGNISEPARRHALRSLTTLQIWLEAHR